jgi:hypothetical protein
MGSTEEAVEQARKTEQEAHGNMVNLFAALAAQPQDPENKFTYNFKSDSIISTGKDKADIEVTFPIAEDAMYKRVRVYYALKRKGYSSYGGYKTFVRIESDHWEVRHKHNWTFETKDLAKKVHAKVGKMVKELKHLDFQRKEKVSNEAQVKEFLNKKFGENNSIYATGDKGSAYLKEGKIEYRLNSKTFSIEFGGLTEDQFDRILAIKKESELTTEKK